MSTKWEFQNDIKEILYVLKCNPNIPYDAQLFGISQNVTSGEMFGLLLYLGEKYQLKMSEFVPLIQDYTINGITEAYGKYLNIRQ